MTTPKRRRGIEGQTLSGQSLYDRLQPPHTKTCWAGALGRASAGRPPEDGEITAHRALELLASDPTACHCTPINRGSRRRR